MKNRVAVQKCIEKRNCDHTCAALLWQHKASYTRGFEQAGKISSRKVTKKVTVI